MKIGGDKIPTVREKPVKTLGRLYSIPLTDRHSDWEIGKVRLHMMMKNSVDEIIRKAYPDIKSGTKWSVVKAYQWQNAANESKTS